MSGRAPERKGQRAQQESSGLFVGIRRTSCGGFDRPETAELPRSRRPRHRPLDHDALNLVDGDCVRRPVVELRRLRRGVPGDPLRVLEGPPVRQVRRDPRRPERVAAGRHRQFRGRRAPLDHGQDETPRQRPARQPPPRGVDALEERRLRLVEPGQLEVVVQRLGRPMVGRDVVPLAALPRAV